MPAMPFLKKAWPGCVDLCANCIQFQSQQYTPSSGRTFSTETLQTTVFVNFYILLS